MLQKRVTAALSEGRPSNLSVARVDGDVCFDAGERVSEIMCGVCVYVLICSVTAPQSPSPNPLVRTGGVDGDDVHVALPLERRQQLAQLPRRLGPVILPRDQGVLDADAPVRPLHVVLHGVHQLRQVEALVHRHELAALRVVGRVEAHRQLDLPEQLLLVVRQVPDARGQPHRGDGDVPRADAQVTVEAPDGLLHGDAVVERLALA